MTLSTNINTGLQFRFGKMLFKEVTTVHFSWDQMMKRKACLSFAARAFAYFICHFSTFMCVIFDSTKPCLLALASFNNG